MDSFTSDIVSAGERRLGAASRSCDRLLLAAEGRQPKAEECAEVHAARRASEHRPSSGKQDARAADSAAIHQVRHRVPQFMR